MNNPIQSTSPPLPGDPTGNQLCQIFGRQPWDFILSNAPKLPQGKPAWRTVTDYPLRPRVLWEHWQDPNQLIGVRFDDQTHYGLIDIDAGSPYCTPEAIADIKAALETIGITRTLLLRSSWSNGLHLYIPLPDPVKTFDLAVTLQSCLTAQDLQIAKGTLEIFPNPKPYGVEKIIHYNGHRLPLQPNSGSCLLNADLNPISGDLAQFLWVWNLAADHQDIDELRHALKIGRDNWRTKPKRHNQYSRPAEAWRQDMETDITGGWSGPGQTNHLLKTIACYGHVFLGLEGQDLEAHTHSTATHLPGYQMHCRHQHDIKKRIAAWCKAVEKFYWPYGSDPKRDTQIDLPPTPNINQQRAEDARERIRAALTALQSQNSLPIPITRRAEAIMAQAHIAKQTLYRPENLKLWHPEHCLEPIPTQQPELPQPASNPASLPTQPIPVPKPLKPPNSAKVHTLEKDMKCKPVFDPGSTVQIKERTNNRGVRGDASRFPQPTSRDSIIYQQHYSPLPPPPASSSEEEQVMHRNREALRHCLFQLKWRYPHLTEYVAEQFGGLRPYQLSAEHFTLLVYRLRARLLKLPPE